jgi:hypothetical protein
MSRSERPRSSIVARLRHGSDPAASPGAGHRNWKRQLSIRVIALARWLHVYVSLFGLAAVLFFSATGLTLNHPTWLLAGAESSSRAEGQLDRRWLHRDAGGDPSRRVEELAVVEYLRRTHGIRGALAEFRVDEPECTVSFRGPGYSADAFIDLDSGRYQLTQTYQGLIAVLNDLHRGRDAGPVWSLVIDILSVGLILIALTGLVLLLYLKRRKLPGLLAALVGAALVVVLILIAVS